MATNDPEYAERSAKAMRYLEKLIRKGYSITHRYVDGRFFVYAKHPMPAYPDLSCMSKEFVECIEQMKIDEEEAKKT